MAPVNMRLWALSYDRDNFQILSNLGLSVPCFSETKTYPSMEYHSVEGKMEQLHLSWAFSIKTVYEGKVIYSQVQISYDVRLDQHDTKLITDLFFL